MYTTIAQINLVRTERYTLLLTHVHISKQTQVCTCIYKDHPHSHTLNVITTHSYIRTHTDNIEVPTNAQQQVENTNELGPIVNAPVAACSPIHTSFQFDWRQNWSKSWFCKLVCVRRICPVCDCSSRQCWYLKGEDEMDGCFDNLLPRFSAGPCLNSHQACLSVCFRSCLCIIGHTSTSITD